MSDTTKLQATVLTEMFLGLGAEATEERLAYYLRLLASVPPDVLAPACDAAVMARDEGYPPSPGAILREARRIRGGRLVRARQIRDQARRDSERRLVLAERAGEAAQGVSTGNTGGCR